MQVFRKLNELCSKGVLRPVQRRQGSHRGSVFVVVSINQGRKLAQEQAKNLHVTPAPYSTSLRLQPAADGSAGDGWRHRAMSATRRTVSGNATLSQDQKNTLTTAIGKLIWRVKITYEKAVALFSWLREFSGKWRTQLEGRALHRWFASMLGFLRLPRRGRQRDHERKETAELAWTPKDQAVVDQWDQEYAALRAKMTPEQLEARSRWFEQFWAWSEGVETRFGVTMFAPIRRENGEKITHTN